MNELKLSYDKDQDVLYLSFGYNEPAMSHEDEEMDGLVFNYGVFSYNFSGLQILGAKTILQKEFENRVGQFLDYIQIRTNKFLIQLKEKQKKDTDKNVNAMLNKLEEFFGGK